MNRLFAGILAVGISVSGAAMAEGGQPNLEGTWAGSGTVVPSNGAKERASCRVQFKKYSDKSYKIAGECSTASLGKVKQEAIVQEAGSKKFKGHFKNPQFNVEGRISIVLNSDTKQTATLTTDKGQGVVVLSKR